MLRWNGVLGICRLPGFDFLPQAWAREIGALAPDGCHQARSLGDGCPPTTGIAPIAYGALATSSRTPAHRELSVHPGFDLSMSPRAPQLSRDGLEAPFK